MPNRISPAVISLLLALLFVAPSSRGDVKDHVDGFDLEAFRALSAADKCAFVLKALEARDTSLKNVSFTVSETHINVRKDNGSRRFMTHYSYEIRRADTMWWMRFRTLKATDPDAGIAEDSTQNWNGNVGRRVHLPPYSGRAEPSGDIVPKLYNCFYTHRYPGLLGFTTEVAAQPVGVSQWLRDAFAKKGTEFGVSDDVRNGRMVLRVTMTDSDYQHDLWIDPNRGFMTVRFDHILLPRQMESLLEVDDAEQVAGVWVPKRAVGHNTVDYSKEVTETTHELKAFSIGSVKADELALTFPAKTLVTDLVNKIAYVVLPNGKYQLKKLADPRAGVVRVPPEPGITDHVDAETAKTYRSVPILLGNGSHGDDQPF